MLIGRAVGNKIGHDPESTAPCLPEETTELFSGPEQRIDRAMIGDIETAVPPGGLLEGKQAKRCDTELLKVVELLLEASKVAHPIIIRIEERAHIQQVEYGMFEERLIIFHSFRASFSRAHGKGPISTAGIFFAHLHPFQASASAARVRLPELRLRQP